MERKEERVELDEIDLGFSVYFIYFLRFHHVDIPN